MTLTFGHTINNPPYDSATITINGKPIDNITSWKGNLGGKVRRGGNSVTLTVRKAGCADVTTSRLVNIVPGPSGCGLIVTLGSRANLASGELTETIDLFHTQGTGLPLDLQLHYLSQDGNDGPLGLNWTHNFHVALVEDDAGTVALRKGNGQWVLYTPGPGGYLSAPGDTSVLSRDAGGLFTLTQHDGSRYEFGADNQLARIVDRNGNALTLSYSGGTLSSVADNYGRTITFTYAGGVLTSVTDPAGAVYRFNVGTTLNGLTLPDGGAWQFSYQGDAFLIGKIDPAGYLTTYRFDEQLRVIGSTDPEGQSRAIAYPTTEDTVLTSVFTEKDGSTWRYRYDVESGDLLAKTDPEGNTTSYTYDANHNQLTKTDASGTTSSTYDAAGNMTSVTDPAGQTTRYSYNAYGQVTSVTDAAGEITGYSYDGSGNLTTVTAPDGGRTNYQYDGQGRLTGITTATGEATTLSYDAQGNVNGVTGPDGKTTTFTFDANGRRTAMTDADGRVTRYEYDANGQLIRVIDAAGNTTRYEYDAKGNRTRVIDANGRATTFTYNFAGQMVSLTDALGYTTTFAYGGSAGCASCGGGVDQLTSLTDAKGQATLFKYNPLGRLLRETNPLGQITEYAYDAAGRVTGKTNPNGQTIHYSYDALGRLIAKTYPDGTQTTFSYDAKGNLLDAANASIAYAFAYDANGRLIGVADSFGHQIDYSYDAAGKRTGVRSNSGLTITYAYDDAGRLAQLDSPAGALVFGYDTLGRRNRLAFPNGVTTTYSYDALGRLTDLVSANGASRIAENHYTHDKVGNRLSNRDARSTLSYGYDAIDRLTEAASNAPGASGNTRSSGKGITNATQNQREFYVYDPVGNRLQTDKISSTTHNAGNELLTAAGTRYSYDANGNRTQKVTASGTTSYSWDAENRLTQVTLPDGRLVTFAYDPFGRRISKTADGVTTRYTYDGEDILFETVNDTLGNVYIHGPGIDEPLALLDSKGPAYYHADGLGSIVALTDDKAKVVQRYEYDSFGNRKDMQNTIKQPYTYTGREHDRETGLYYYRARYYDGEVGVFLSKDPIGFKSGQFNLYSYVSNNPVNLVDPTGLVEQCCPSQEKEAILERIQQVNRIIAGMNNGVVPTGNHTYGQTDCYFGISNVNVRPYLSPCIKKCVREHEDIHATQCEGLGMWNYYMEDSNNNIGMELPGYQAELKCLQDLCEE